MRSLEEGREWLRERLERSAHPLDTVDADAARDAIDALPGLDPESWAAVWGAAADRFASGGDGDREALLQAYRFSFLGRYPVPNHAAKQEQYARARRFFLEATSLDDLAAAA